MEYAVTESVDTVEDERHLPGEGGVWIFIVGDMIIFSVFFCVFLYYRSLDPILFDTSREQLNQHFGAFNTLLLLTSSWFVVLALQSARKNLGRYSQRLFLAAFLCGVGFAVSKFFEYGEKIGNGITLTTNDFFMFYYVLTAIHFLHLIIGMGVLFYLYRVCAKASLSANDIRNLESGASYWHMVDLLWIVLFPLLYLVR